MASLIKYWPSDEDVPASAGPAALDDGDGWAPRMGGAVALATASAPPRNNLSAASEISDGGAASGKKSELVM